MKKHIIKRKTIKNIFIPITLLIMGCSNTYSVPNESKVLLPVKKSASKQSYPKLQNEDQLIIKAIFLEEAGAYRQSNEFYALLYNKTKKEEYLLKELSTAYMANIISPNLEAFKVYTQSHPEDIQAQRLLLSFYLKGKKFNKAKEIGEKLTQNSQKAVDFELAANPYIFTGKYKKSLDYLTEAYNKTLNEDILLKIVTIKINYLKNIDDAIEDLETHQSKQGCSEKICLQLAAIYAQQHKNDKLVSIYKKLYQSTKKEIYLEKIVEGYLLNKDLESAIVYLEKLDTNPELLYSLYMEKKAYKKANQLAHKLSQTTNKSQWYAEVAISLYESLSNKNDKTELQKIVQNFEKAFELGEQNPVYLNYYGYTLINKEIDVPKGLEIIKKALKEEPANTYFLDSLAWGYYKLNNCEKAYPSMKKVVEIEGLKDEEIIEHWNAIDNKCKK